jgi:F-type H+-transporting ATPase subunit beta
MAKGSKVRIVQVIGQVVDIEFPPEELPEIYHALEIQRDSARLVAEVQQHLGNNWVRTVVMDTTDGLRRGMIAIDTGGPITVPVGPSTLGRIFNVTGEVIDQGAPVKAEKYYPIHRPAPSFEEQVTTPQFFETGMKVIDLVAPFIKGGKVGVFGAPNWQDDHHSRTHPCRRHRARRLFSLLWHRRTVPRRE